MSSLDFEAGYKKGLAEMSEKNKIMREALEQIRDSLSTIKFKDMQLLEYKISNDALEKINGPIETNEGEK
jgi:hypothetical protein